MDISDRTKQHIDDIVRNAKELVEEGREASMQFTTVALWLDLLGFRKNLDIHNWDIKKREVELGLLRISILHEAALLSVNKRYEIVQANDALIVSQDLEQGKETQQLSEFLGLVDFLFEVAAEGDRRIGGCGVRGVVCEGSRFNLRGNLGWLSKNDPKERPAFFCPRPIMMNTAFGRAYGVESSKELLKATSLYVEESLLRKYLPSIMESWTVENPVIVGEFGSFFVVRRED